MKSHYFLEINSWYHCVLQNPIHCDMGDYCNLPSMGGIPVKEGTHHYRIVGAHRLSWGVLGPKEELSYNFIQQQVSTPPSENSHGPWERKL